MTRYIRRMMPDHALLTALGERLHQQRLAHRLSQAELATQAGVAKRTIERIESGESVQLANLLRVLRVLGLVDNLSLLVPEPPLEPVARIGQQTKVPQRVRKPRAVPVAAKPWLWGEDA